MNVCFVANKHLTITFARIAHALEKAGHRVYWASPSRRWTNWLIGDGFDKSRILSIPDFGKEWRSTRADPNELAAFERPPLPTCPHIIQMCRYLRAIDPERARSYLLVVLRLFSSFAAQHEIDVVFSESTWGFELAIALASANAGVLWLHPTSTRIPGDRFGFFSAFPHQLVQLRKATEEDRKWAESFLNTWRNRPTPPSYSRLSISPVKFQRHWLTELSIGLFARRLDADDYTLWPVSKRVASRLARGFAAFTTKRRSPFAPQSKRPFVLMCLHQQPEASIDVFGAFHSNQAHAVKQLARILPATHDLWVKEHPDAIGSRSLGWYRQFASQGNVVLIDPHADTFDLCRRASLVVSISGTVAYEAALLGTPAATLAPIFFSPLLAVDPVEKPDSVCWDLPSMLDQRSEQGDARAIDFLAWVKAQSFPGMPYDPLARQLAGCDPDDVQTETTGFLAALDMLHHVPPTEVV